MITYIYRTYWIAQQVPKRRKELETAGPDSRLMLRSHFASLLAPNTAFFMECAVCYRSVLQCTVPTTSMKLQDNKVLANTMFLVHHTDPYDKRRIPLVTVSQQHQYYSFLQLELFEIIECTGNMGMSFNLRVKLVRQRKFSWFSRPILD